MFRSFVITLAVITIAKFGEAESVDNVERHSISFRITNGIAANQAEFPYIAAIEVADTFTCGASIISPYVVLTAAHCTSQYAPVPFLLKVRAGTPIIRDYKGPNVQMRLVKRIVNHPQYNISAYNDNDIAILWLKTPFTLNSYVNVVNLANRDYSGTDAVIIGWGRDENFNEGKILKRANVQVIGSEGCAKTTLNGYKITSNMVCSLSKSRRETICKGDSGGPMIIHDMKNPQNDILVGITSYGRIVNNPLKKFCDTKSPAVYANVVAKHQWIVDELEKGL